MIRLQNWVEEYSIIKENQMDFKEGRGTTENIFTLISTMQLHLRLKLTPIYPVFIALTRAFD